MTFPSNPNDDDLHEAFGRRLRYRSGKWQVVSSPTVATVTEEAPKTEAVAQAVDLPMTGNEIGAMTYVQESNRLYVWNGSGWFEVALVNTNPTITAGGSATYELATDGTPTVVTLTANDPEGIPLAWSYTVTSGSLGGTTITNVDNVFTITPSTDANDAGTFQLTFTASDGVNVDTSTSSFSLSFAWMGDDVFSGTTNEFTYHLFSDLGNPGKLIVLGDRPGRVTYHELGSSTTTWRKKYADPIMNWTSSSQRNRTVAADGGYIYHVFTGRAIANQPSPGFNLLKLHSPNGTILNTNTMYNWQYTETAIGGSYYTDMNAVVDPATGKLFIVAGVSQRMTVTAIDPSNSSYPFLWGRSRYLSTSPVIDEYGGSRKIVFHDNKIAYLSNQSPQYNYGFSSGIILEVLSDTGTSLGGVQLLAGGTIGGEGLHYYNGKYYCIVSSYNSSIYVREAYLCVINASTLAIEGAVKLKPDGINGVNASGASVYADASGIYTYTLRYIMKLDFNLNSVGCWKTTSNGTTLITPSTVTFNNGNFYFPLTGASFTIAGGPLDGSVFGTQKDTFNLVPVSHSTSAITLNGTTYNNIYENYGAAGYAGYNSVTITTTDYANYNVS